MKKTLVLLLSITSLFAQRVGPTIVYSGGSGGGQTYVAGTGITISGNTISATGTNVAVVVFDTTQFTTNGAGALEILSGALLTNIVVTSITNTSLAASSLIGADATKKIISIGLGSGLDLTSGTLSVTTIGAIAGTVLNSGASLATAIPEYSGTSGTNIVPSKLTVTGLTNLNVGVITVTNQGTFDNIVVTNGIVVGSLTNNSLTASKLTGTDATKKSISISVGDGLTNSANTLQVALTAGANVTFATNNGNITITGSAGGGGTVGSVINTGASVANQVPVYSDTTGTNVVPSNVTITAKTNLAVGTLVVTNTTTFGDGTTAALETYPVGGTITNAANNVGLTNALLSVFNSNVIFQVSITNNSLTASQIVGTDATKKEVSIAVGNGLTNAGGTSLSVAIIGGANITITTNSGQLSIAAGSAAPTGTVIDTGASLATALPEYSDTSGTNIIPTKILVNLLTNLSMGTLTVTNQATFDNIVVTNGATFGNVTNNGLTASKITGTDSTKKAISISVGDGLTNNANTLQLAIAAGANVTLTTNSGQITLAATGGGTTINATGGPLFASTADATVVNTTTETSIIGTGNGVKTLTANYLVVGKDIHIVVRGRMGTKTITPGALTIKLKFGSTILATNIFSPTASLANDYIEYVADVTCRTTGASGTVFSQSSFDYNDGATTTVNRPLNANTTTSTIDTTATQAIDVTATWVTADANNTITGSIVLISDGTGGTATTGTMVNSGASLANALPIYSDTSGTNIIPTKITVSGLTNLLTGALTVSNTANTIVVNGNTMTFPSSSATLARTDAGQTFTGNQNIGTIDVGNTDTTITRSAAGIIAIEGVDVVNTTTTQTLQNKTVSSTWAGGNNTLTARRYLPLQFTRVAVTSMIINSNDFSLASYGRVRFPGNSTLTNSNYAIYRSVVPIKFVGASGQDLTLEKLTVKTTGTQTGAFTFNVGVLDIADSAAADATDSTSFANYVAITSATLTSPAANDRFSKANVTLTGWRSALTAGDDMAICIVRNDTNTDGMDLIDCVISYVETQ